MTDEKTSKDVKIVGVHIPKQDIERLDFIVKEYRFKSRYQLLKYIIQCFLKVADPRPEEVVNKDIEEMFDGWDSLEFGEYQNVKRGYDISSTTKTDKEIKATVKKYADRYVKENFAKLESKFKLMDSTVNEKGVSSLDKLNDTILSLYETNEKFSSYKLFKLFADRKFTPKEKR